VRVVAELPAFVETAIIDGLVDRIALLISEDASFETFQEEKRIGANIFTQA
jgi:hypothetical protein